MTMITYCLLKAGGEDIAGFSSQGGDLENAIECLSFEGMSEARYEGASMTAIGTRQHTPFVFTKRFDHASPLLMKALCERLPIEAEFRFFTPDDTGVAIHYYTIKIENGRIGKIRLNSPNAISTVTQAEPDVEEVHLSFPRCTWTHVAENKEHTDDYSTQTEQSA